MFILLSIVSLVLLHSLRDALIDTLSESNQNASQSTEQISYQQVNDTLTIEIPFSIPYANHQTNEKVNEELILVYQGDYYKVFCSVFTGDKLTNIAVKINPTKQEIFQILGQLITLEDKSTTDPLKPIRQLSTFFADYFWLAPLYYTHWFWVEYVPSIFPLEAPYLLASAIRLSPPPPRFI